LKFKGSKINSCWEECVKWFLDNCEEDIVRGRESVVVRDVGLELYDYDRLTELNDKCVWSEKTKELWVRQVDQASRYSEMERIYDFGERAFNQYDYIIKVLKNYDSSKQAIGIVYDPEKDSNFETATPCLTSIYLDKYNNKIDMYASFTVTNLFSLGLLDIYQLAYLHEKISKDVSLPIGTLKIRSMKVYMNLIDYTVCRQLFAR
jgi:thymidylate synthase